MYVTIVAVNDNPPVLYLDNGSMINYNTDYYEEGNPVTISNMPEILDEDIVERVLVSAHMTIVNSSK